MTLRRIPASELRKARCNAVVNLLVKSLRKSWGNLRSQLSEFAASSMQRRVGCKDECDTFGVLMSL